MVQERVTFWINVESAELADSSGRTADMVSSVRACLMTSCTDFLLLRTQDIVISMVYLFQSFFCCSLTQLPATTPVASTRFDIDLSGCGVTKGCFRSPRDCDVSDCDAVVTWTPRTDASQTYIEFELQTRDDWVALGFSDDTNMVRHFSGDTNMVRHSWVTSILPC